MTRVVGGPCWWVGVRVGAVVGDGGGGGVGVGDTSGSFDDVRRRGIELGDGGRWGAVGVLRVRIWALSQTR